MANTCVDDAGAELSCAQRFGAAEIISNPENINISRPVVMSEPARGSLTDERTKNKV